MYSRVYKRLIDVVFSLLALIILLPLLILLWVILTFVNNGHALFIQSRPGMNEKEIKVIKFKSMNDKRDIEGNLLPDVDRMTWIGRIIRKSSMDELPQLINVLKGDMSLIGPRPLLFKYIPLYSAEQRRRHDVRPGITGLAQVEGRNVISWEEKFKYDVQYVDNLSFWLDIKIFFITIQKVLETKGVNQSTGRPMQPFKGNNHD